MRFPSTIAFPILLHLAAHARGFVIPEGEQQVVFLQGAFPEEQHHYHHIGQQQNDQWLIKPKEKLDDLFKIALAKNEVTTVALNEQEEDNESAYANSWISLVEKPKRQCGNSEKRSTSLSSITSLWNTLRECMTASTSKVDRVEGEIVEHMTQDRSHENHPHPPHKQPHHKKSRHHPHNFTDATIYENLGKSNYTKKIFALIKDNAALVKILNSTNTNITFFAPIDTAFDKIPEHGKNPSEDFLQSLLYYHTSKGFYPAGKVLLSHTVPSLLRESALGSSGALQRLRIGLSLHGLTVNFYSKIILADIFASNGVIHAIDHILVPPPPAIKVLELLPGEFSTLVGALYKTGIIKSLSGNDSTGLTLFAPTNDEFKRLGPKILSFLFSKFGEKYLAALLKYHIVPDQTLYSDAWYKPESEEKGRSLLYPHHRIPKGRFHADLKTLLNDRSLSIDIFRWGRFVDYKINSVARVAVQDGIVKDGVIQVPNRVLIPPKTTPPLLSHEKNEREALAVEEFKARLDPYIDI